MPDRERPDLNPPDAAARKSLIAAAAVQQVAELIEGSDAGELDSGELEEFANAARVIALGSTQQLAAAKRITQAVRRRRSGNPHGRIEIDDLARARFESSFVRGSDAGCWKWSEKLDRYGYGKFQMGGRVWLAHRFA